MREKGIKKMNFMLLNPVKKNRVQIFSRFSFYEKSYFDETEIKNSVNAYFLGRLILH